MKTSVEDLREHLFAAIERLNSAERDQLDREISRAKAVAEVAREITSTAKTEIEYIKYFDSHSEPPRKFFEQRNLPSLGEDRHE